MIKFIKVQYVVQSRVSPHIKFTLRAYNPAIVKTQYTTISSSVLNGVNLELALLSESDFAKEISHKFDISLNDFEIITISQGPFYTSQNPKEQYVKYEVYVRFFSDEDLLFFKLMVDEDLENY